MEANRERTKVIMLPTASEPYKMPYSEHIPKSNIVKGLQDSFRYQKGLWYKEDDYTIGNYSKEMYQHLYFINDEEIKEGDWYLYKTSFLDGTVKTQKEYDDADWNISQCVDQQDLAYIHRAQFSKNAKNGICGCYKIIATTDPELVIITHTLTDSAKHEGIDPNEYLPQPSQAFIEKYCKVGGIDEVDVEYEKLVYAHHSFMGTQGYQLKVDSHNTITIHPIKDSWTREEVRSMLIHAFHVGPGTVDEPENMEKWIEDKLNEF